MTFVWNEAMLTLRQLTGVAVWEYRAARVAAEVVGDACIDLLEQAANDLEKAKFQEDEGQIYAVEKEFAAPMKAETVGFIIAGILSELLNGMFKALSTLTLNNMIQIFLATIRGFGHVGIHFGNVIGSFIPFVGSTISASFMSVLDVIQGQFMFNAAWFTMDVIEGVFAFFTQPAILAPPIVLALKAANLVGGIASLSLDLFMRGIGAPRGGALDWLQAGMGQLQDAMGVIATWAMPNIANAFGRCDKARQGVVASTRVLIISKEVDPVCSSSCGDKVPIEISGIRIIPAGDDSQCLELDEQTKRIHLVPCAAGSKQIWYYDGQHIRNRDGSLCLEPAHDGNGGLTAAPCNSHSDNQKWKLDDGSIISNGGDCVTFGDDGTVSLQSCPEVPTTTTGPDGTDDTDDTDDSDDTDDTDENEPASNLECSKKCKKTKHCSKTECQGCSFCGESQPPALQCSNKCKKGKKKWCTGDKCQGCSWFEETCGDMTPKLKCGSKCKPKKKYCTDDKCQGCSWVAEVCSESPATPQPTAPSTTLTTTDSEGGSGGWLFVNPFSGMDDGQDVIDDVMLGDDVVCKPRCYNKKHGSKSWTVKEKGTTPKCWWNACGGCSECSSVSLAQESVQETEQSAAKGWVQRNEGHAERSAELQAARQARKDAQLSLLEKPIQRPIPTTANKTLDAHDQLLLDNMYNSYSSLWPVSASDVNSNTTDLIRIHGSAKSGVRGIISNKRCVTGGWKYDKSGWWAGHWVPRGDWNIPVYEIYWQHGWHHSGAGGCEYGNSIPWAFSWWCPMGTDTLEWGQSNDLWRTAKCWDDENWLDNTLRIADNFPDIITMMDGTFQCLDGLQGDDAKWKIDSILNFWIERALDPIRFFTDLVGVYITPTLDAFGPWSSRAMKSMFDNTMSLVQDITSPNAKWLTNEWGMAQLDKAWDLLTGSDGLVKVPGLGPVRCLIEQVGHPIYTSSKEPIAAMVVQIMTAPAKAFDDAVSALEDFILGGINAALSGDNLIGDLSRDIRFGVMDACLAEFNSASVKQLAAGLDTNFDQNIDMGGIMVQVVDTFMDRLHHYVVRDFLAPISKKVCDVVVTLLDLVLHALDAVAGAIPWVWAAYVVWLYVETIISWTKNVAVFIGHKVFITFVDVSIMAWAAFLKPIVSKITRFADALGDAFTTAAMDGPLGPVMNSIQSVFADAMKVAAGPQVWKCQHTLETLSTALVLVDEWQWGSQEPTPNPTPLPTTPAPTTPAPTPAPPTPMPTPGPTPKPPAQILTENWWSKFDNKGWAETNGGFTGFYRNDCNGLNCIEEVQYAAFPKSSDCYDANWWSSFDNKGWSQCKYGYFITGLYRNDCNELGCLEQAKCCKQDGEPGYIYEGTGDACTNANWYGSFDNKGWSKCPAGKAMAGIYRNDCDDLGCIEEVRCCPYE
jgi:hypothetical protein